MILTTTNKEVCCEAMKEGYHNLLTLDLKTFFYVSTLAYMNKVRIKASYLLLFADTFTRSFLLA